MNGFTYEQISVTTAEEELSYFTGDVQALVGVDTAVVLPPGTYRVIEGSLYRVVGGVPQSMLSLVEKD